MGLGLFNKTKKETIDYLLQKTSSTPEITLKEGTLYFKGISMPEDAEDVYKPIIEKIDEWILENKLVTIDVDMTYINTTTTKQFLEMFGKYAVGIKVNKSAITPTINWHYEKDDEAIFEAGQDYQSIVKGAQFKFLPK